MLRIGFLLTLTPSPLIHRLSAPPIGLAPQISLGSTRRKISQPFLTKKNGCGEIVFFWPISTRIVGKFLYMPKPEVFKRTIFADHFPYASTFQVKPSSAACF